MKIKFTRNAERRLAQIRDYHASQGNPKKGVKIIKAVRKDTERLKEHPRLGQEEEGLKHLPTRSKALFVAAPNGGSRPRPSLYNRLDALGQCSGKNELF